MKQKNDKYLPIHRNQIVYFIARMKWKSVIVIAKNITRDWFWNSSLMAHVQVPSQAKAEQSQFTLHNMRFSTSPSLSRRTSGVTLKSWTSLIGNLIAPFILNISCFGSPTYTFRESSDKYLKEKWNWRKKNVAKNATLKRAEYFSLVTISDASKETLALMK